MSVFSETLVKINPIKIFTRVDGIQEQFSSEPQENIHLQRPPYLGSFSYQIKILASQTDRLKLKKDTKIKSSMYLFLRFSTMASSLILESSTMSSTPLCLTLWLCQWYRQCPRLPCESKHKHKQETLVRLYTHPQLLYSQLAETELAYSKGNTRHSMTRFSFKDSIIFLMFKYFLSSQS